MAGKKSDPGFRVLVNSISCPGCCFIPGRWNCSWNQVFCWMMLWFRQNICFPEVSKKTEKGQKRHNFRCFGFGSFQPPFRISWTGSQAIEYGSKCWWFWNWIREKRSILWRIHYPKYGKAERDDWTLNDGVPGRDGTGIFTRPLPAPLSIWWMDLNWISGCFATHH